MTGVRAYRRDTCRLCGRRHHELALQLAPTPLADAYVSLEHRDEVQPTYPLDLSVCRGCGHVQLLDVVHPEAIYREYIYETTSSLGLAEHFRSYAEEVFGRIAPAPGSFAIDLGSNDGTLLRCFAGRGMRVLGIDPAREIARRATAAGIETLPLFFSEALGRQLHRERGPAAIITSNNLVANVDDLDDFIEGIRALLAPDGVFVFESFYLADLMRHLVFDFIYHEHLSYFSVKPLETFFRRHGMELVDVLRVTTKGGSLRYTVQRAGGPRKASPAVAEMMALETESGLDRPETFRAFAATIDQAKGRVVSLLRDLTAQGKRIDGFGASATTTTLLYHFGLGDMIGAIYDDNAQRHHLFSPGLHLPVLPPQALYERKPDAVVMLAWRYAQPIMARHRPYLEQGGRFVIPLPAVQLLYDHGRDTAASLNR